MPPRAASRRVGRPKRAIDSPPSVSSPTEPIHSPLPRLQKPQLPKLKGTPSSRRQYTYGAGEEPLPARAGHRMRQDEELDLGNAVGNLLERQEEEDTRERMPPPPPPRQPSQEEDAQPAETLISTDGRRQGTRLGSKTRENSVLNIYEAQGGARNEGLLAITPQSDDVSLRSFATESDIFGDAMISSPPDIMAQTAPILEPQVQFKPQERLLNRRATREPSMPSVSVEPAYDPSYGQPSRGGLVAAELPPKPQSQPTRQAPRKSHQEARVTAEPGSRPITRLDPPGHRVRLVTATKRPQPFPSDYSEQDDEIQNSIRLGDQVSEDQGPEVRQPLSPWKQGLKTLKRFSPFRPPQHFNADNDDDENEEEEEDSVAESVIREPAPEAREWPRFLTLSVYTNAVLRFIHLINDHVTFMLIRIGEWAQSAVEGVGRLSPWVSLFILFLAIAGSWTALSTRDGGDWSDTPRSLSDTLGQIHIPSLPGFSLPFGGRGKQAGLIDLSEDELQALPREIREMLNKMNREYAHFTDASRLQANDIKAIKDSLPDMVYMEKRGGKPHVPETFWSPFRSRLMEDSVVLKHLVSGALKDPAFTSKLTASLKETEDRVERKFTDQWDHWVADNNDKVNSAKPGGMLVTKDEFARHLEDFTNNQHDIRAALNGIKPEMQSFVREALEEVKSSRISTAEVTTLIRDVIKKELSSIQLDTHAKSEMNKNWYLLRRNINWFNPASGATINAEQSSKTWRPATEKKGSLWSIFTADPSENMVALEPWFEEGDCWCATHDHDARKKPHGAKLVVQLGRLIIPQHIVLEHIHSSATTDPGARPKIIEVYGNYHHDDKLRERVLRFAHERHFKPNTTTPDEAKDHDSSLLGWQFVMVGRFEYQEGTDGVHVHRLSEQLEAIQAETDEVAIRVVANDGNQDHTCFYRVRMFGQRKE